MSAEPAVAVNFDHEDELLHLWARMSSRLGIIAMGLCIAGPASCGMSYALAVPAGAGALYMGYNAIREARKTTPTRAYAKVGMITGGTALLCSSFSCLLITSYFLMIFALIGVKS